MRVVMLSFRVFRAAVFAEPTITKVEEVVGLIHGRWGRRPPGKQLLTWLAGRANEFDELC